MTGMIIRSVAVAVSIILFQRVAAVMNQTSPNQRIDSKTLSLTEGQCK